MRSILIRTTAVFLMLMMLIPLVAGCKKTGNKVDGDTTADTENSEASSENGDDLYDENGYLKDSLDPSLNYGKCDFKFLTWNSGYDSDFFAEIDVGDTVIDSVYYRNKKVEERLNVVLKADFIEGSNQSQNEFVDTALNAVMSGGNCEYDMIGCYSMCAGTLTTRGALQDLMSLEHLDFSKPWWSDSLIHMSKLGDRLFFVTGDAANTLIYNLYFLVVNKNLLKELKLDDPRKSVRDGTWTLDKMFELTKNVHFDADEPGLSTNDRFGFVSYGQVHMDCFLAASGIRMAKEDSDGVLKLTDDFLGEKTHDLIQKLNNWLWNQGDCCYNTETGYKSILNGNALLGAVAGSTINTFRDVKWEYNILPYPKLTEEQDQYYTNLGFGYTNFCVPLTAKDADMSAAVLECMGSESYRSSAPTLFETCLKSRWAKDGDDAEMYDIIKGSIYVDVNRIFSSSFEWFDSSVALFRYSLTNNDNSWQSKVDSKKDYINGILANISASVKE